MKVHTITSADIAELFALNNFEATTTATATTTPQNNKFKEEKQSLCACVLNFGKILCRPLQNNNMK